jgi:hypothetical protein
MAKQVVTPTLRIIKRKIGHNEEEVAEARLKIARMDLDTTN